MIPDPSPVRAPARSLLNPVTVILVCAACLTLLGLTILLSASAQLDKNPYLYVGKQVQGVIGATIACLVVSRINFDQLRRYTWWIAGISFVLLALVLIPGIGQWRGGARRWLGVGSAVVQVSEFAKFSLIFCLAHYLALNQTRIGELKRGYLVPLALIGAFVALVLKEPDFGTSALMLTVGLVMMFLAGAKWRHILPTVVGAVVVFGIAVALNPNRLRRLLAFLDFEGNKQGGTYQLYQGLTAFAAGGLDGAGLGQGRQQLDYLYAAHTDFIFSVVGEELGLWFTLGVVAAFTIIFVAGVIHLRRAPNLFHFLLAAGCLLMICVQAIINIGVVTGLLPTKGMPLPFLSSGLSNLLLMGILLGVFINTQRTWGRAKLPVETHSLREVTV